MTVTLLSALSASLAISVDAFVISACEGVKSANSSSRRSFEGSLPLALTLATTSTLLLVIGYSLRLEILVVLDRYDHWVAFGLLLFVSFQYCYEALHQKVGVSFPCRKKEQKGAALGDSSVKEGRLLVEIKNSRRPLLRYFMVALAVSIDALALGFSLSEPFKILLVYTVSVFVLTFSVAQIGALILRLPKRSFLVIAKVVAACVLLGIAFKILYEHGVFQCITQES